MPTSEASDSYAIEGRRRHEAAAKIVKVMAERTPRISGTKEGLQRCCNPCAMPIGFDGSFLLRARCARFAENFPVAAICGSNGD